MSIDHIRYDRLIENALREVVHNAMAKVAQNGFQDEHHFYISFLTHHPGVEIPDYLMEKYKDEMTIVLQHQFFGLTVDETGFSVLLSFNNIRERLAIPYEAITTFADPSVDFALQFQNATKFEFDEKENDSKSANTGETNEKSGEVISLDNFRKK